MKEKIGHADRRRLSVAFGVGYPDHENKRRPDREEEDTQAKSCDRNPQRVCELPFGKAGKGNSTPRDARVRLAQVELPEV